MNNRFILYILFTFCLFCSEKESTYKSKERSYKKPEELLSYIDSVKKQYGQNSYTESVLYVETVNRIKKADDLFLKILRMKEYRRQFEACSLLTEAVICEILTSQNKITIIERQSKVISYLHELNMYLKEKNILEKTRFKSEIEKEKKRLEEERRQVEEERKQEEKIKQVEEEKEEAVLERENGEQEK